MHRHRGRVVPVVGLLLAPLALATGCSSADGGPGATGAQMASASLVLAMVPADVACVQVVVAGTRTVSRSFATTPGAPAAFVLPGLPLGPAAFSASAYPVTCDTTSASSPTWTSDVVNVTLVRDQVAEVKLALHRRATMADAGAPDTSPDPNVAHKQLTPADSNVALGDAVFMYAPTSALVTVTRRAAEASLPQSAFISGFVYEVDRPLDGALRLPLLEPVPADPVVAARDAVTGEWISLGGMVVGQSLIATTPMEVMLGQATRQVTTFSVMSKGNVHRPFAACGGALAGNWTAAPRSSGDVILDSVVPPSTPGCPQAKYRSVFQATLRFNEAGGYSASTLRRDQVILDYTPMCLDIGGEPPPGPPCGTPGQLPCPERSCARVARDLNSSSAGSSFCTIPGQPGGPSSCDYRCVGDFEAGCVCSSYGWPRAGTESGTYTTSGTAVSMVRTSLQGPPGTLLPIGVLPPPEIPMNHCVQGNVLRLVGRDWVLARESP
jgi:hypothetical protein